MKGYTPIFMVSVDLKGFHKGYLNVITEYIPETLHTAMTEVDSHDRSAIFTRLTDGRIEVGDDGSRSLNNLAKFADKNRPLIDFPGFLVRLAVNYDAGLLQHCIGVVQEVADAILHRGVGDDQVMTGTNYAFQVPALDNLKMVVSNKVPHVSVSSNIKNRYRIIDIYSKVHKPLKSLIKRAYLVPHLYNCHIYDGGYAKLWKMSSKEIKRRRKKNEDEYINWPQMQKIRAKQREIFKVTKKR